VIDDEATQKGGAEMGFGRLRLGSIAIDGVDVRQMSSSTAARFTSARRSPREKFRGEFAHTPVSVQEKLPWKCRRLVNRHAEEEARLVSFVVAENTASS
jgi:hypothetical protein